MSHYGFRFWTTQHWNYDYLDSQAREAQFSHYDFTIFTAMVLLTIFCPARALDILTVYLGTM
eukprot:m.25828 g.25828  ORF g.25828 m.25828 type:complete len:62 (-) comp11629_c0_seq6:120-305(-)